MKVVCPVLVQGEDSKFVKILLQHEGINLDLVSLVPLNESWFHHSFCNKTDHLCGSLSTMFEIAFAC